MAKSSKKPRKRVEPIIYLSDDDFESVGIPVSEISNEQFIDLVDELASSFNEVWGKMFCAAIDEILPGKRKKVEGTRADLPTVS